MYNLYFLPYPNGGFTFQGTFPNASRLWRGTRRPNFNVDDACRGADPNRNWDRMWGTSKYTKIIAEIPL